MLYFTTEEITLMENLFITNIMNQGTDNNSEQVLKGLSRGQVRQIIRRNMISRVKPSGKVYDRKKNRKDFK